jgi:hypothetical protein
MLHSFARQQWCGIIMQRFHGSSIDRSCMWLKDLHTGGASRGVGGPFVIVIVKAQFTIQNHTTSPPGTPGKRIGLAQGCRPSLLSSGHALHQSGKAQCGENMVSLMTTALSCINSYSAGSAAFKKQQHGLSPIGLPKRSVDCGEKAAYALHGRDRYFWIVSAFALAGTYMPALMTKESNTREDVSRPVSIHVQVVAIVAGNVFEGY